MNATEGLLGVVLTIGTLVSCCYIVLLIYKAL